MNTCSTERRGPGLSEALVSRGNSFEEKKVEKGKGETKSKEETSDHSNPESNSFNEVSIVYSVTF